MLRAIVDGWVNGGEHEEIETNLTSRPPHQSFTWWPVVAVCGERGLGAVNNGGCHHELAACGSFG